MTERMMPPSDNTPESNFHIGYYKRASISSVQRSGGEVPVRTHAGIHTNLINCLRALYSYFHQFHDGPQSGRPNGANSPGLDPWRNFKPQGRKKAHLAWQTRSFHLLLVTDSRHDKQSDLYQSVSRGRDGAPANTTNVIRDTTPSRGRDLISTGRGGAGNIVRSPSRDFDPDSKGHVNSAEVASRALSTGRGGASNIRGPSASRDSPTHGR
ncbi:hypothetical protein FIBSPDRAFT_905612, partial [Athelia psychrophila]